MNQAELEPLRLRCIEKTARYVCRGTHPYNANLSLHL